MRLRRKKSAVILDRRYRKSMAVTRTTLLGGPAAILWRGHTLFAQDGILVTPALELAVVDSAAQGVIDATASHAPVTIQFSPTTPFADLLALYPFLDGALGTSLFGAVDTPLVLIAANGVRLTFAAAAIVQMPDLTLSSSGVAAGAVTFVALGARALPVTVANRVVTIDTADFPAASTPPQLADDFEITWGAAPWLKLQALDGVKVKFVMKSRPVWSAAHALVDMTLESLTVTAQFTPGSPGSLAEADALQALQLAGVETLPGRLLSAGARTLDIAGEHLWVRLPFAQVAEGPLVYDATKPRLGELVFTSVRAAMGAEADAIALAGLSEGEPG